MEEVHDGMRSIASLIATILLTIIDIMASLSGAFLLVAGFWSACRLGGTASGMVAIVIGAIHHRSYHCRDTRQIAYPLTKEVRRQKLNRFYRLELLR